MTNLGEVSDVGQKINIINWYNASQQVSTKVVNNLFFLIHIWRNTYTTACHYPWDFSSRNPYRQPLIFKSAFFMPTPVGFGESSERCRGHVCLPEASTGLRMTVRRKNMTAAFSAKPQVSFIFWGQGKLGPSECRRTARLTSGVSRLISPAGSGICRY